jgi:hypothetical protein
VRYQYSGLWTVLARLQLELVRRGYRVLIAAPHGSEWYFYLMRRLAERPANVLFLVSNLLDDLWCGCYRGSAASAHRVGVQATGKSQRTSGRRRRLLGPRRRRRSG